MNRLAKQTDVTMAFDPGSQQGLADFLACHPEAHFWLLVNPLKGVSSMSPVYPQTLAGQCLEGAPQAVLVDDLAWAAQSCPQLWQLAQPSAEFIRQVLNYACTEATQDVRAVCALIASEQSGEQLAEQLVQTCRLLGQACGKTSLTFPEPLRFELLYARLAAWLPEDCHWWYVNAQGETGYLRAERAAENLPGLNWGMMREQQEIRNIARLLRLWQATDNLLQPQAAQRAASAWLRALDSGLTHAEDCFWLALTGLTQPEILAHPQCQALQAQVVQNPAQRLIDYVDTLPAERIAAS